jgi:hypothetical protein
MPADWPVVPGFEAVYATNSFGRCSNAKCQRAIVFRPNSLFGVPKFCIYCVAEILGESDPDSAELRMVKALLAKDKTRR